jgi:hypothetical protein
MWSGKGKLAINIDYTRYKLFKWLKECFNNTSSYEYHIHTFIEISPWLHGTIGGKLSINVKNLTNLRNFDSKMKT